MKFKVGDKVRFVKKAHNHTSKVKLGKVYMIDYVESIGDGIPYRIKEYGVWFIEDELELVKPKQFTKSDLKDGDIVTQRDGRKKVVCKAKTELRGICERASLPIDNYTKDLIDKDGEAQFDIIKVERPVQYETVYERKEEILDEAEKRYLRDVIRPFRDKVGHIRKQNFFKGYYININVKHNDGEEGIDLPYFNKNTMYKGMKLDKEYTLEELRTIKE